jgi:serine protease Do
LNLSLDNPLTAFVIPDFLHHLSLFPLPATMRTFFRTLLSALAAPLALSFALAAPSAVQAQGGLPDFADLVERTGPAVVNIRTTEIVKGNARSPFPNMPDLDENDPLFEFFKRFMPPGGRGGPGGNNSEREVPRGVGSGFILSPDGYIMTNAHVVRGADEVTVTLTDKREFKAKIIGADQRTDVALVKIEATGLPAVKIGDPNRLRVGEWVLAIGSPFGLDNTVTAGIVSAKGRETGDFLPFIQTDVAVNPGNSGGPLINMRGEVVGINSQIYTRTGSFAGISFAIPIDEATRVGDQLRASGRVQRGRIGVRIDQVTKEVAEGLGLPKAQGALVAGVESGTPADKAGIKEGDVILKFDGKNVEKSTDLPRIVGGTKPGNRSSVELWRKGKLVTVTLTVGELEPDKSASAKDSDKGKDKAAPKGKAEPNALGMVVGDLTDAKKKEAKVTQGVVVEVAEGLAGRAGLRAGDVITQFGNDDVTTPKQFNDMAAKHDKSKNAVVLIKRGEVSQFVLIKPERK